MVLPLQILSAAVQVHRVAASVLVEVRRVTEEDRRLRGKLKNVLAALVKEIELVEGSVTASSDGHPGAAQEARLLQLQEVLYDVEDFLQRLRPHGQFAAALVCLGLDRRSEQIDRVQHFREQVKTLRDVKPDEGRGGAELLLPAASTCYAPEAELVGIDKPRDELLEHMSAQAGGMQLRVISLVGRRGVGKTALARVLYERAHASADYNLSAWVVASDCCDANALLDKILQSLPDVKHGASIHNVLKDKRYMLIIDDLREGHLWQDIKKVFPENLTCSCIVVTTSVRSVASSCRGHIHTVESLSIDNSRKLFWEKVQAHQSRALEGALDSTFDKCGGLPLALISVANHLLEQGNIFLKVKDCQQEGQALGRRLAGPETTMCFQEIRKALDQCYSGLPDHLHRMCLLSLTMFPKGHKINIRSLVRELIAGGLVAGDDVRLDKETIASACIEELINRSILEAVTVGIDYEIKRCKVSGIMLEFMIHKSSYRNFAMLIHDDDCLPKFRSKHYVRRLSIHGGSEKTKRLAEGIELSSVRWMRISNSNVLVDLKTCKLLRVLSLECCFGINEIVMKGICQLILLKYLSLRGSDVGMIPKRVKNLKNLETLDIRQTNVTKVPSELLKLPQIVRLFGEFELPYLKKQRAPLEQLTTLAGVVIASDWRPFDQVLKQVGKQLKKIKILCEASPIHSSSFEDRIQERFSGSTCLDSLTIDSSDLSKIFISFLKPPCGIRSIKLRGALERLPDSSMLKELGSVQELYLTSVGLTCEDLTVLQILPCLVYLKLSEPNGFTGRSKFISHGNGFESLQRLCFEAPKLPQMVIELGGMKCLASLDLLCLEFSSIPILPFPFVMTEAEKIECQIGVHGIKHLDSLSDITLHPEIDDTSIRWWKEASILHKNKPCVKRHDI